ncbi:hypothetical protein FNV43_RR09578 [Rhamnella rubrinervis]|uniref:Uncharacterized protein n=1 Tax=Rhamnella rubrinervis TaxID=2594499 RepID=A0A8K0HA83_9ROSA|nr:hypothetical protein FNV43_RR09578 [Rhamnella rubrinervis]
MSLMGAKRRCEIWVDGLPNPVSAAHGKDSRGTVATTHELRSEYKRQLSMRCGKSFILHGEWHAEENGEKRRAYAAHITASGQHEEPTIAFTATTLLGVVPRDDALVVTGCGQLHHQWILVNSGFGGYRVLGHTRKDGNQSCDPTSHWLGTIGMRARKENHPPLRLKA